MEDERNTFHDQLNSNLAGSVVLMGQGAYAVYQNGDQQTFAAHLEEIASSMGTHLYLLFDNGMVPRNEKLDEQAMQVAREARESGTLKYVEEDKKLYVAKEVVTTNGQRYLVVGIHTFFPPPPRLEMRPPPNEPGMQPPPPNESGMHAPPGKGRLFLPFPDRHAGLRVGILIVVAGLVCYLLARSFSSPINRLREVSRQIAAGDLSARVGELGQPGSEITDLGVDFDKMADRMEHLVQYQKRLLQDISHELRSPLARLGVAVELVRKESGENESGMFDKMNREIERLNVLIGRLLELSKSERQLQSMEKEEVDLSVLLQEIVDDAAFEAHGWKKGVVLSPFSAEIILHANRELLREAIENIVRNGLHFTAEGTDVEISAVVRDSRVTEGKEVIIQVRDCGPGIPDEDLHLVLQPFYRVSSARERRGCGGGVGLGLSIAERTVKLHGGRILLTNIREGGGLAVTIFLPVQSQEQ
jgi:two-component system sensor histidine kinase CpxA